MFRVKLGDHITIGDISKGPQVVVECDQINELADLFQSRAFDEILKLEAKLQPKAKETVENFINGL